MNIINEFFVSFILIKLYFKFKVCRKIKFPLLWKFYFSKWKFYFSADNSAKILLYSVNFEEIENLQSQDKWQEAAQILTQCAKKLELAGANFIIIATNTMHKVFDEIQQNINIPILHIAKSSAKALKQENIQKIGLLGTKYTMTQDFYKKMLIEENISVITPSDEDIKIVNDIIFNELCKGEIKQDSKEKYLNIIKNYKKKGQKECF